MPRKRKQREMRLEEAAAMVVLLGLGYKFRGEILEKIDEVAPDVIKRLFEKRTGKLGVY
ncbi:unnamed protein product [marine sediment metagenome]|uniref:Uncharacterized protein n=1 Tax=marine sediment metagenome TaxID=412755 RepID=X1LDD7_9ZZZZ